MAQFIDTGSIPQGDALKVMSDAVEARSKAQQVVPVGVTVNENQAHHAPRQRTQITIHGPRAEFEGAVELGIVDRSGQLTERGRQLGFTEQDARTLANEPNKAGSDFDAGEGLPPASGASAPELDAEAVKSFVEAAKAVDALDRDEVVALAGAEAVYQTVEAIAKDPWATADESDPRAVYIESAAYAQAANVAVEAGIPQNLLPHFSGWSRFQPDFADTVRAGMVGDWTKLQRLAARFNSELEARRASERK